ncbi:Uma2 family endonuclease [Pseudanabaena sp. UWO310]|uniref:Uma2 family endonuclease n=1 Tax=Pseudanabaena sp. UWO310 TaxID=2480795 RepID=UPI00115909B9|nr:Uma2 family endonuclease [Pseudanabaena sp. UWO310]TYQ30314.1 Uma2 family endonuclease [Pseudanabaena sp. UWO310]
MMQTLVDCDRMSFAEFIEWYPENGKRYELYRGVVREMMPIGDHELTTSFLAEELTLEIRSGHSNYLVSRMCLLKPEMTDTGFIADVVVLDRRELVNEPLWQKASVIQNGKTVPLVIEVVSTNWSDDYAIKLAAYETMGIAEYWIVDYRALGAVRYIGKPKQPTVTVCKLIEGEYQLSLFTAGKRIESDVFPELNLMTDAIFQIA